jgi:hypothetical protein
VAVEVIKCLAGRVIEFDNRSSSDGPDDIYIKAIDGETVIRDRHYLGVGTIGVYSRVEKCGRCVGNPARKCDLNFKVRDLTPQE